MRLRQPKNNLCSELDVEVVGHDGIDIAKKNPILGQTM
jgi:hypothetical protein